ncbi:MAG: prepilin-type N-terminal cleavage/methylation domain-containing protein, partial [Bacilli bacterium]
MKKIYKQKVKRGFTLVELLGVIAILAVVITISVPLYNSVKKSTLKKQYENVIATIETAAEKYANETHQTTVNVEDLIEAGYISADDQKKIYNPINKESLNCYTVVTTYENGVYVSEFKEDENLIDKNNNTCKKYEKTSDVYICVNGDTDCKSSSSVWYNKDVGLNVKLPKDVDLSTVSYEWTSTVGDNFTSPTINVGAESLKTATYTVSVNYKIGDKFFTGKASREIKIDKQKPNVDLDISNEKTWSQNKSVTVKGSDGVGSGIKGYYFTSNVNSSCPTKLSDYQNETGDFKVTSIGTYKACVSDKAGNISEIKNDRLNIKLIDLNDP